MKQAARVIASLAIAVTVGWAAYRFCYLRSACNLEEARAERGIQQLFDVSNQLSARIVAREAIESMNRCIPCSPTSVNNYMARAAALRMLGRPADAALDYKRALHVDRRAELYLNLGLTEMEAGRNEQAADSLTTAVYLLYTYIDDIPQPMRDRIRAAVTPTYVMIQQRRAPEAVVRQLRYRVTRDPL